MTFGETPSGRYSLFSGGFEGHGLFPVLSWFDFWFNMLANIFVTVSRIRTRRRISGGCLCWKARLLTFLLLQSAIILTNFVLRSHDMVSLFCLRLSIRGSISFWNILVLLTSLLFLKAVVVAVAEKRRKNSHSVIHHLVSFRPSWVKMATAARS